MPQRLDLASHLRKTLGQHRLDTMTPPNLIFNEHQQVDNVLKREPTVLRRPNKPEAGK